MLSSDYAARIQQFIAQDQMPTQYGGTCSACSHNPNGCIQPLPKAWARPVSEEQRKTLIIWDYIPAYGWTDQQLQAQKEKGISLALSGGVVVGPVPPQPIAKDDGKAATK